MRSAIAAGRTSDDTATREDPMSATNRTDLARDVFKAFAAGNYALAVTSFSVKLFLSNGSFFQLLSSALDGSFTAL